MADGMREKTTNVGGVIKRIWYAMTGATQGAELASLDDTGKFKCVSEQITGLAGTGKNNVISDELGNLNIINMELKNDRIVKSIIAFGDTGHFSTYDYTKLNADKYCIDAAGAGCLQYGASLTINTKFPYGIVIGDSIAAGSNTSNSGLAVGNLGLSPVKGQYAYDLAELTGVPMLNHGIPSDTLTQVRNRWNRDILAQNDAGLSPTRTIPVENGLPHFIFLHCGINDVHVGRSNVDIMNDYIWMAESCKANGIIMIMDNVGGISTATVEEGGRIEALNALIAETMPKYGVTVIDYFSFTSVNGYTPKTGMLSDGVHPYPKTYVGLANNVINNCKDIPIFLNNLILHQSQDPLNSPAGFLPCTSIDVISNGITTNYNNIKSANIQRIKLERNHVLQAFNGVNIVTKDVPVDKLSGFAKLELELTKFS